MSSRIPRIVATMLCVAMVFSAVLATPAEAKKKKKKKPPVAACAAYVPGELGAEAETSTVTDANTAEAPVTIELDTGPGLGFSSTDPGGDEGVTDHVYHNVLVDSSAAETGLYARVEFPEFTEYDIFVRLADGTTAAYAAGANQTPVPIPAFGLDGTGNGGHSEFGAEQIDGLRSPDCTGYTIDVASAITPGGGVTLTLWLGEATYP